FTFTACAKNSAPVSSRIFAASATWCRSGRNAMTSIRRQLLVWLLVGLAVAVLTAAFTVYMRARIEAGELFDYQLQLMATAFPRDGFGSSPVPGYEDALDPLPAAEVPSEVTPVVTALNDLLARLGRALDLQKS